METINISITKEAILEILQEVKDPEIPTLSVVDLGIISEIILNEEEVIVKMMPTFVGCPAIHLMQEQIREKILFLGIQKVKVIIDYEITWSSDRISEEGKKKLEKFGIGSPASHNGNFSLKDLETSRCPHCKSSNTTMNSLFGSTLCRSIHFCFDCKQSFERFKPL